MSSPIALYKDPALPRLLQLGLDVRLLPGGAVLARPLAASLLSRLSCVRTYHKWTVSTGKIDRTEMSYLVLVFSIALVNSVLTVLGSFSNK